MDWLCNTFWKINGTKPKLTFCRHCHVTVFNLTYSKRHITPMVRKHFGCKCVHFTGAGGHAYKKKRSLKTEQKKTCFSLAYKTKALANHIKIPIIGGGGVHTYFVHRGCKDQQNKIPCCCSKWHKLELVWLIELYIMSKFLKALQLTII